MITVIQCFNLEQVLTIAVFFFDYCLIVFKTLCKVKSYGFVKFFVKFLG